MFTRQTACLVLLLSAMGSLRAQAPTLTAINPPTAPIGATIVNVILTGTGFTQSNGSPANGLTLTFNPAVITYTNLQPTSATALNATFTISSTASGKVNVTVNTSGGNSQPYIWDTGIIANQCIEALKTGGCALRWEFDVTGVSGSGSQTNTNTAPNILTKLDWQYQSGPTYTPEMRIRMNKNPTATFVTHGIFELGYTQVPTATKVQPTTTSTSTTPSSSCAASSSSIPASCMTTTTQQAFVAGAGTTLGATFSQDGRGTFSELGVHIRGSVQDLVQNNQVVQNGGLSYLALTSSNPKDVVGLYEGTARFRLASLGHDKVNATSGKNGNSSSLILIEAGYQYNSGLAQLASNPQTNTKNRFVGRFYLYPEIPGPTHTKGVIGMEYSGGIAGGPKVIQIFWGTNLNPVKLFSPSPTPSN
jgi:hypothetical protein